jgi:hypothetical protein
VKILLLELYRKKVIPITRRRSESPIEEPGATVAVSNTEPGKRLLAAPAEMEPFDPNAI